MDDIISRRCPHCLLCWLAIQARLAEDPEEVRHAIFTVVPDITDRQFLLLADIAEMLPHCVEDPDIGFRVSKVGDCVVLPLRVTMDCSEPHAR